MDEKNRLIAELDGGRERLTSVLARVESKQEIYPGWTVKELLAHIAGWDDASVAALKAHAGGDEPGTPAARGIDFYNAQTVSTRASLRFAQVSREWEVSRDQLKAAIQEMPAEKLFEPVIFPWAKEGTIAQLVAILASHEEEHAEEIESLTF